MKKIPDIVKWCDGISCCNERWEAGYSQFETESQEIKKFCQRLDWFGVETWSRDLRILEIFCGRGNGLHAWSQKGFRYLAGVDLSGSLLSKYQGNAQLYLGDCREIHLDDSSIDVVSVQGGLHHLPVLPTDLIRTLDEVRRILKPGGHFLIVEPWQTPFLKAVHYISEIPFLRRCWSKLDAFAIMYEEERATYDEWLRRSREILELIHERFSPEKESFSFGKLRFSGRKKL